MHTLKLRHTFTSSVPQIGALALVLLASACSVKITDFNNSGSDATTEDSTSEATTDASSDASSDATSVASVASDATTDATTSVTTDATTDASTTGSTTSVGTSGGIMHAQCNTPVNVYPEVPPINMNEMGDPAFADWEKLDCEALDVTVCTSDADCDQSKWCMLGMPGGQGVCTEPDVDVWCDGEGEAMNYESFGCFMCSTLENHAKACCDELPGFDCRAWPYDSDGPINSVCAVHDDCEPGLVCGSSIGSGYGICQCPEGGIDGACLDDG